MVIHPGESRKAQSLSPLPVLTAPNRVKVITQLLRSPVTATPQLIIAVLLCDQEKQYKSSVVAYWYGKASNIRNETAKIKALAASSPAMAE